MLACVLVGYLLRAGCVCVCAPRYSTSPAAESGAVGVSALDFFPNPRLPRRLANDQGAKQLQPACPSRTSPGLTSPYNHSVFIPHPYRRIIPLITTTEMEHWAFNQG